MELADDPISSPSPVPAAARQEGRISLAPPPGHDDQVLDMFLALKAERSIRTAEIYGAELARFRRAVSSPLHGVTLATLQGYIAARRAAGAKADATRALTITVLRSFFRFAVRLGYLPLNPAELLQPPRVPWQGDLRWCTAREIRRIIAAAQTVNPTAALVCVTLALTGMRIAEVAEIRMGHFLRDPHGNIGLRVIGKGRKRRLLKIRPDLWARIAADRQQRSLPDDPEAPLFPNRWGRPCSTRYLRRMMVEAGSRANIGKRASPHWLRHSYATLTLAGGAPLRRVQDDMGHGSLTIVARYLHVAQGLKEGSADFLESMEGDQDGDEE